MADESAAAAITVGKLTERVKELAASDAQAAKLIEEVKKLLGIGTDAPDAAILGDLNLRAEARKRLSEFLIQCTDEYGEDDEDDVQDAAIRALRKVARLCPDQKIVELAGKGDTCFPDGIVEAAKQQLQESTDRAVVQGLLLWAQERKDAETKNRPDENIHKKALVATWNQVITRLREASEVEEVKKPGVGLGVVCFQGGRILLGKRHPAIDGGGQWELPGGSLKWGESWEEGARREVQEETGLPHLTDFRFITAKADYRPEDAKHNAVIFVAFDAQGVAKRLEPKKSQGWEWFRLDKLPEGPMFPALRKLLTADRDLLV